VVEQFKPAFRNQEHHVRQHCTNQQQFMPNFCSVLPKVLPFWVSCNTNRDFCSVLPKVLPFWIPCAAMDFFA
jgi:hypothetical protein